MTGGGGNGGGGDGAGMVSYSRSSRPTGGIMLTPNHVKRLLAVALRSVDRACIASSQPCITHCVRMLTRLANWELSQPEPTLIWSTATVMFCAFGKRKRRRSANCWRAAAL